MLKSQSSKTIIMHCSCAETHMLVQEAATNKCCELSITLRHSLQEMSGDSQKRSILMVQSFFPGDDDFRSFRHCLTALAVVYSNKQIFNFRSNLFHLIPSKYKTHKKIASIQLFVVFRLAPNYVTSILVSKYSI